MTTTTTAEGAELVFIPIPGMGHIMSTVQIAKLMVQRDHRLFITVLIMRLPTHPDINTHIDSLSDSLSGFSIRFLTLPTPHISNSKDNKNKFFTNFIKDQVPGVRDAIATRLSEPNSPRLAGLVIDMFCTCMIDVGEEFALPSYLFFTSSAPALRIMFHIQELHDEHGQDPTEFKASDADLTIPGFANPVPTRVLPSLFVDKEGGSKVALELARGFRQTKGIMVNTFQELEPYALESLSSKGFPPVYPVGPMVNLDSNYSNEKSDQKEAAIMAWLEEQPPESVVFLCFGSMGSFNVEQVQEIARGLEDAGHRFLWALRRPPPQAIIGSTSDYENPEEVLPEGFLGRTGKIGKVIGWAPQVAVLSHPAIGGFVSHCGWNSTLESLWFGVPMATWPIYAEQQLNAFEMVKELGLAVELTLDYKKEIRGGTCVIVSAEQIAQGIRHVMEPDSEVRRKVGMTKEASRKAIAEGGASYTSLGRFINNVIDNTPMSSDH